MVLKKDNVWDLTKDNVKVLKNDNVSSLKTHGQCLGFDTETCFVLKTKQRAMSWSQTHKARFGVLNKEQCLGSTR